MILTGGGEQLKNFFSHNHQRFVREGVYSAASIFKAASVNARRSSETGGIAMKRAAIVCLSLITMFLVLSSSQTAFAYDTLKMLNSTGKTIYNVYLAPKDQGWKNDRLEGVWHTGATLTLNVPNYRLWALKLRFKDGEEVYFQKYIDTTQVYNLTISRNNSGGYTLHYNS